MARREKTPEELRQEAYYKDLKQQLREKFRTTPVNQLNDADLLAIFLSYSVKKYDFIEAANILIDHYGSFRNVLDARYDSLRQFPFLQQNAAVALKAIPALCEKMLLEIRPKRKQIKRPEDAQTYMYPYFVGYNYEQAFLLLLNDRDYPIDVVFLADGSGDDVYLDQKKIIREALMHKSKKIILAHSHPTGTAHPSYPDLIATQKLHDVLQPIGITIMDHLIFSGKSCCYLSQDKGLTDNLLAFSHCAK